MDFFDLIKTILGVMPFIVLCFACSKANLHKADRSRQFLMPLVALIYCIVAVIFLDKINTLIFNLFEWLRQYLPFLAKIKWQSIVTYVLNTVLIVGFLAVKGIVLPILNGIWKSSNKINEYTSAFFYEREEDVDKWLLNPKFANFRGFIKGFYLSSLAVSVVIFVLSQNYKDSIFFQAAFYPVFGVIVLGEVYFFLSGITKSEFVEDILGEDEESYKVANYGALREILRDLFGDRVLHESTCDTADGIFTTLDELDEMALSEDPVLKLIGNYFLNLKESGAEIDINYVRSAVNLLNGKSTLFCNPFYHDLTPYITLSMIKHLIAYKKCLIVLGRDSALEDVESWIKSGLESFSNTDSLWQTMVLDEYTRSGDVGIIKFSDIHNLKIHKANREFLKKVGFVFIIEPSRILASGQIGLSLLVNNCENTGKDIVYCACDRNCDGLVDALSHTLKTSITEVTATVSGGGNISQMYWNAEGPYMHHKIFPNITRYLGMGTEINSVAMKYQISNTGWVGSEKFPVLDMKWIAGQYHNQICQYADLPEGQASFDRSFNVYSNLWSTKREDNAFLVVEDEFQNLFEITRVFASRAKSQGFINVVSENYFLRDYMLDNVDVFTADPKAIPTIVPDFARTERNMVLKLIMMMAYDMVSEDRIAKELMLCGITFDDPYVTLKELIIKHCHVEDASLTVRFREEIQSDSLNSEVVKYFEIDDTNELYEYAKLLKNAYYIAEDEEGDSHYIGAKLYGHVFQAMLPGQFMTFDGKYYEVQTITHLNGVVVRRAADHISNRRYYRQIRKINLDNWMDGTEMGSKRTSADMEITRGFANLSVETDGYLEMNAYGNLAKAKKVSVNAIPDRHYRNKSVLKIKLPEKATARIRYTICLLLNEIFHTTYPETYHYISALTPFTEELATENLEYASYKLEGECDENCIYIVEDSDIDLGLIVSVERNIKRYLEIVADVLSWHAKKMREPAPEPETNDGEFVPEFGEKPEPKRKGIMGVVDKIKDFGKKLFGKKKDKTKDEDKKKKKDKKKDKKEKKRKKKKGAPEAEGQTIEMPTPVQGETPETPVDTTETPAVEETPAESATEDTDSQEATEQVTEEISEETASETEEVSEIEEIPEIEEVPETATEPLAESQDISETSETDNQSDEDTNGEEEPAEGPVSLSSISHRPFFFNQADEASADVPAEETPMDIPADAPVDIPAETPIETPMDEPAAVDIAGEDEELATDPVGDGNATEYQKHCFIKFGYDSIDAVLDIEGTIEFLKELGYDKNPLQQVRDTSGEDSVAGYDPHKYGAHLCDFCGVELLGGEFDVLKDGRERCNRCSMTAVKKAEDFKALYKTVLRNMEAFYGIKINVAVKVRTTNAKQIAKQVGMEFVATPGFDGRVLGFARKDKTGYSLYIENGSPKLAAAATIAHELTHIWQYLNWDDAELTKKYGKQNMLEVYEGMAKWAEIQYLMLMNEKSYAKRQEIATRLRDDEYGRGFIIYADKYPLSSESSVTKTPFKENPPL